jgi:hypothetical protein
MIRNAEAVGRPACVPGMGEAHSERRSDPRRRISSTQDVDQRISIQAKPS